MRRIQTTIAALAVLGALGVLAAAPGCGGRHDDVDRTGSGDRPGPGPAVKCPPGNAVVDGACVAVITADKIAAVAAQKSRIDDLAKLLDQVDTAGAPIELLNTMRQLPPWQQLKAKVPKLALLDGVAAELDTAVKTLRTFKASLGEASSKLGNLGGQLDQLMTTTGAARQLADVRTQVSSTVRGTLEPLAAQVQDAIQHALVPLNLQLTKVSRMIITGCTMSELSGGGDKLKELCGQAEDTFAKGRAYIDGLKDKPAQLFNDVTGQLEAQLGQLVDGETRKLLDAAQTKVNDALKLPPPAAEDPGAGSGAGSGSAR